MNSNSKKELLSNKALVEEDLKKIDKEIKEVVNKAAAFAQNDNEPDVSELYTDIVI